MKEKRLFGFLVVILLLIIFILVLSVFGPSPRTADQPVIAQGELQKTEPSDRPKQTEKEDIPIQDKKTETDNHSKEEYNFESLLAAPAGTKVDNKHLDMGKVDRCFYSVKIDNNVFSRIKGKSFGEDCSIDRDDLRYVKVLHYGFDDQIYVGELIVNKLIAEDIKDIFLELFEAAYPIEQIRLIDDYEADDELSMTANNTSCFNFRTIAGSSQISNHAKGLAIDINPLYNPYVKISEEVMVVQPDAGKPYTDRELEEPYYIEKGDLCYEAFSKRGFRWGGEWNTVKDYQHFEIG